MSVNKRIVEEAIKLVEADIQRIDAAATQTHSLSKKTSDSTRAEEFFGTAKATANNSLQFLKGLLNGHTDDDIIKLVDQFRVDLQDYLRMIAALLQLARDISQRNPSEDERIKELNQFYKDNDTNAQERKLDDLFVQIISHQKWQELPNNKKQQFIQDINNYSQKREDEMQLASIILGYRRFSDGRS